MEINPKNYAEREFDDPELYFLTEKKNKRWTRHALRKLQVPKQTINLLLNDGYRGVQEIYDAPSIVLLSIKGIGRKRFIDLRSRLLPHFLEIVS